jgi:toxin ParE1/3/4
VRVRLTASAEADIERIGDRIAEDDSERARLTVRAVRATARSIGGAPYLSSPVVSSPGVRKKTARPYLLLYSITGGEVVILRIAHERSDWASLV